MLPSLEDENQMGETIINYENNNDIIPSLIPSQIESLLNTNNERRVDTGVDED